MSDIYAHAMDALEEGIKRLKDEFEQHMGGVLDLRLDVVVTTTCYSPTISNLPKTKSTPVFEHAWVGHLKAQQGAKGEPSVQFISQRKKKVGTKPHGYLTPVSDTEFAQKLKANAGS